MRCIFLTDSLVLEIGQLIVRELTGSDSKLLQNGIVRVLLGAACELALLEGEERSDSSVLMLL